MTPHMLLRAARRRLCGFAEDHRGTLTLEFVIVFPLLIVWWVATVVFFDVFRTATANERAAYAIGDMLSRQTETVDDAYIDGLNLVYDYLIDYAGNNSIRATSITFDEDANKYLVQWSRGTRGRPDLSDSSLAALRDYIPIMPDGETVIIVETLLDYEPLWDQVGLAAQTFSSFIVVRPRFAPKVVYEGVGTGGSSNVTADDDDD